MVYLNPPYFIIQGVSLLPDEQDPLQFYYLPMMPHITMVKDPVTSASTPQAQLIEYVGAAGSGGFFNLDVNLGVDPSLLSDVGNELQRKLNLTSSPKLSPMLFTDGSIALVTLGAQSGAAPASASGTAGAASPAVTTILPPPSAGPQFVIKIQNAAKPALYGDNQATFSVQLDKDGATIFEKALTDPMTPVAIIYSLQFLALRPAFKVHMTADWNRVQKYIDDHYSGGCLFYSADIEKTVDKLIEDQVINIQVDTFTVDPGTAESSDRDRAVSECYELIKTNFFTSSLPPPDPSKKSSFMDTFRNVSDMALTGGAAGLSCFSHKHVDLTRTDNKMLDFNVSERTSVLRTIYPQGHLYDVLSDVQRQGFKLSDYIVRVDLDNPFFTRRKITVLSNANFVTDSIASIIVRVTYNEIEHDVKLTSTELMGDIEWTSLLVNNVLQRGATYSYTVNFQDVDTSQRPGQLTSGVLSTEADTLDIQPRADLYQIKTVPVRSFGVPWDRYSSVEVAYRYSDPAHGINLSGTLVLTDATPASFSVFTQDLSLQTISYQLSFAMASGGVIKLPWTNTTESKIDVLDPYPSKLKLQVTAALNWTLFSQALVFIAYPDKQNAVFQQAYTLTATAPSTAPITADRKQAGDNFFYYEARLIRADGTIWSIPGSVTSDPYLILQDQMKGHQVISVVLEKVDFDALSIAEVTVSLRYVDAANKINQSESLSFSNASDVRSFSYYYLDASINAEYSSVIRLQNNQVRNVDWATANGNLITVLISQFV